MKQICLFMLVSVTFSLTHGSSQIIYFLTSELTYVLPAQHTLSLGFENKRGI